MQRDKFALEVGALADGGAAATGDDASTTVQGNGTVDIRMAEHGDAVLGIDGSTASNGDYLLEGTERTALDITDSAGNIVGSNATERTTTVRRDLFDIKNQGTTGVFVFINTGVDGFGFFADYPANVEVGADKPAPGRGAPTTSLASSGPVAGTGTDGITDDYGPKKRVQASTPARVYLKPGESLGEVGTIINTADEFGSDTPFNTTVIIGAVSVGALGDDISVDTSVGREYQLEVSGFDST